MVSRHDMHVSENMNWEAMGVNMVIKPIRKNFGIYCIYIILA
jgi:hypothetical protein